MRNACAKFLNLQDIRWSWDSSIGIATGYGVDGVLSPGVKRPGREADHSPQSSAKVKNGGAIPPFPHMP
jgi:hypothetical protein